MDQANLHQPNFDSNDAERHASPHWDKTIPYSGRTPQAEPSSCVTQKHFCCGVSSVKYVAFRRRLFAEDVKSLTSLIPLVQHRPESLWGDSRDAEQCDIEALALVMGRNLLAKHFSRCGIDTPLLGTCLRVDGCGVTIIDKAAIVLIDSVDCSSHGEKVKSIVDILLANTYLPEDLKELVQYCYFAEQITVLTQENTYKAFYRSKEKSAALSDVLWPGLLPNTPGCFTKAKYETWVGVGWYPTNAKHLNEKSSQCPEPHALLNVHWEKIPTQSDLDAILHGNQIWRARLFRTRASYGLMTIKKSDAKWYIEFRREIFLYEVKDLIALSHVGYGHNAASEKSPEDISIREAYAFLRARQHIQQDFVEEGIYVPPWGENAWVGDHYVLILHEARLVFIDCAESESSPTIKDIVKQISESSSISDASKILFLDWEESASCSVFILTSADAEAETKRINKKIRVILNEWRLLDLIYLVKKFHSYEFYKTASAYTVQTCFSLGHRSWKTAVLSINIANEVYGTLLTYFRPLFPPKDDCDQFCVTNPSIPSLFVIFPRDWVETYPKSLFDVDCATNRLKIRISLVRFKEIVEELLHSAESKNSKTKDRQIFVGLEKEVWSYCVNILNAFLKPEMALIQQYEKVTGSSILTSCIKAIVEMVVPYVERHFFTYHPDWVVPLSQELEQAREEQKLCDVICGERPQAIVPIDFEKQYGETLEIGAWNKRHSQPYSDDVYRQADSATRPCHYRFDSHNEYEKQESIAETNALITLLQAEFINHFSRIFNLHKRVVDPDMDKDTTLAAEVEAVLNRIQALAPKVDERELSAYRQSEREEFWKRTLNILVSQHKPLMKDLVVFFRRQYKISNAEAAARLGTRPKACVADSIALLAVDRLRKGILRCD